MSRADAPPSTPPPPASAAVRDELVRALRLDLIGPSPEDPGQDEVLPQQPSRWYLTGFLVPYEAKAEDRRDESGQEQLDLGSDRGGDDEQTPEAVSARRAAFPSSIGVSVLVPETTKRLHVTATWGDYALVPDPEGARNWQRQAREMDVEVAVGKPTAKPATKELPDGCGLRIVTSVRPVRFADGDRLPRGTRAVSVFLVNHREPRQDPETRDEAMVFQAGLRLRCAEGFVPRPDLRGRAVDEWDEQVADLQYRDAFELAVGHGVSTRATAHEVATTWLPRAEVEKVEPASLEGVELRMEALAQAPAPAAIRASVGGMVEQYRAWIARQRQDAPRGGSRGEVAKALLDQAAGVAGRIEAGLTLLDDPAVFDAFRIANRTMAAAARQRTAQLRNTEPDKVAAPTWRPFQLAFLLMNLRGIADPTHAEREVVDLLFFPTGGGKTEAYLGLAAFTMVLRRLRNPGLGAAGVSVLMRYTLRLLTLDQLSRAATLVCALELERRKDARLGNWPFEIGLWVGRAATPNRMGSKGEPDPETARRRTIAFQNDDRKPSPIPLESCPWCGTRFGRNSFALEPNADAPTNLRIVCANRRCPWKGDNPLPIVAVDEPLYRRLPAFLIATVDKFASLPWVGQVGVLLGGADRHDKLGFYGPADAGRGEPLPRRLPPPDLIIQDELHLISGPLGTMVGLYEAAIDALASREVEGRTIRPRIVASTATVRRAESQIRALFDRRHVEVFPPPGPDRRDSFFAVTVPGTQKNPRLYLGLAAPGRSPKVMLLRSYLALLGAGQKAWERWGGQRNKENPADPYLTLVGYFNALRELGGSRRIVEDEIIARLASFGERRRVGEEEGLFASRKVAYDVVELTSRESTAKVADAKRRLALTFEEKDAVDVALATNMISVGLDITRLGLMVVLGQPKTTAEYIQATSRVGRDEQKPGLVLTLLNVHRPRDRSHHERFEAYHASFYRAVEVTSVTPFAPRAVDRGLAAITVGLARHGLPALAAAPRALDITTHRPQLDFVLERLSRRAEAQGAGKEDAEALRRKVRTRAVDLLDEWARIAKEQRDNGATLQYQEHEATGPHLLYPPLDRRLASLPPGRAKFKAQRSLRDVEPSVGLWVRQLDGVELPEDPE